MTSARAEEQAAEWFALLRSDEATAADRADWQAWIEASDAHRHAWTLVERVSQRFGAIQSSPDPRSAAGVLQDAGARAGRRQVLLGAAALLGTGLAGWTVWRHTPLPDMAVAWSADHRTARGETREVALDDGTRVWLGSASAIDTRYDVGSRLLRLRAGEVLITTASDAARPFVVDTPSGRVRALGTRFNLRLEDGGQTFVAVFDGAVEARMAAGGETRTLRTGQQARFDRRTLGAIADADPGREVWTQGILLAQDMTLREVAAELDRYRPGRLEVAPDVAGLRVYGSFPLADTDRALAMLSSALPVQARRRLPWWTVLEARSGTTTAR